ncbi:HNH endonuclease [Sphingomonas sp. RB1R13]|uniref:HNH endonuclease n=1 Tax=Sphingomonas sp. RB1R13 TaxID=3096159 RepID=UPI002FCBEFDB
MNIELTPADVRAARAIAQWSQDELAKAAGVGISTIADFEKGTRRPIANNVEAIRRAFAERHIWFTPNGPAVFGVVVIHVVTETGGFDLIFRYMAAEAAAVQEIVATFGKIDADHVELWMDQVVTPELRAAVDALVVKFGAALPQLNKLKQKIGLLTDGEYFLMLPGQPASTIDRLAFEQYLHALNHPDAEPLSGEEEDGLFARLIERYDFTSPRTDRKTVIGSGAQPCVCRFCHRTSDETKFKKVAHVIPTALGNDHLKSAEECDDCNEYFGQHTEPSLIAMLDLQRVFLGTQGRGGTNGRPKLAFGRDSLTHDGAKVVIKAYDVAKGEDDSVEVTLGRGARQIPVAAYRALVKIAVAVIGAEHLPDLTETIDWVRVGSHGDRPLPLVATATIELPSNPSAQITVYTRKEPHDRLPHVVGEFRLGCYMFVFALPFSKRDAWNLIGFFDDPDFTDTFRHYFAAAQWAHVDLSGTSPMRIAPRLKFVRR